MASLRSARSLPLMSRRPPTSPLFPYTTLFRSVLAVRPRMALEKRPLVDVKVPVGDADGEVAERVGCDVEDRKSTRLNSSHRCISYAVFCLKKKKKQARERDDIDGAGHVSVEPM